MQDHGQAGIVGGKTRIDWADRVWEPVTGCTKVSAGCKNCYAERLANGRLKTFHPDGFGAVSTRPERLDQPLHWRKPARIFVCSRSDLFQPAVPPTFIVRVFEMMEMARQHTFLVLTKRPEWMRRFVRAGLDPQMKRWPPANVWLGVSVENQETADERIPLLLDTPAAVRFVSAEPLLGPVDLSPYLPHDVTVIRRPGYHIDLVDESPKLSWVIVGCESGKNARYMNPVWVRHLINQCQAADVPIFVKQMMHKKRLIHMPVIGGRVWSQFPKGAEA